jgi:hypothetical protein
MTTNLAKAALVPLSKLNKTGLVFAFLLGVADLTSLFQPTPDGEVGPPYPILVLDALLGVITVVGVVVAWRTARHGVVRIVAGARIISMITALPAFFVDVPAGLKALVGLVTIVTVASVAMILAPARRPVPVPVTD